MRKEFKTIQTLLRSNNKTVKAGPVWLGISDKYDVGTEAAGKIRFTDAELVRLRSKVIEELGYDPVLETIGGDRHDVAGKSRFEKESDVNVFDGYASVASNLPIRTSTGESITAPGSFLQVKIKELDASTFKQVVVIENGTTFQRWNDIVFEPEGGVLYVYRGHTQDQAHVKDWLGQLDEKIAKLAYFDFDPAGFNMGVTGGFDGLLVPADWESFERGETFFDASNQKVLHGDQMTAIGYPKWCETINFHDSRQISQVGRHIQNNDICIMQEHIHKRSMRLSVLRTK